MGGKKSLRGKVKVPKKSLECLLNNLVDRSERQLDKLLWRSMAWSGR